MKCPKCQADILDDSQFCSKCGAPIHPGDKIFLSHTRTILRPSSEMVPGKPELIVASRDPISIPNSIVGVAINNCNSGGSALNPFSIFFRV